MFLRIKEYHIDKSRLPKSLIISGALYSLIVLVLALLILFIIPVQEKVSGEVEIFSSGLPMDVKAMTNGLLFLRVEANQEVSAGELIGSVIWNISEEEFLTLEEIVNRPYDLNDFRQILLLQEDMMLLDSLVELQGIQGDIRAVLSAIDKYRWLVSGNDPTEVVISLDQEIEELSVSLSLFDSLHTIITDKIELLQDQLEKDRILVAQGGLSQRELEARETMLIDEGSKLMTTEISRQETSNDINLKRSQIAIINSNYSGQRALFKSDLTGSLDDLRKTYYQIKDEKLLRAPIAGVISKLPDVRTGMNVTRDQVIVRVIPGGTQAPQDYLYLAYTRAGEVKPGQKVFVKLDEFPYREYGAVEATVGEIDLLPSSSTYRVRLHLPHPLKTDYGLVLDDRPYYHGMAEVYTLRMNMFHKILREVRSKHKEIMRAS